MDIKFLNKVVRYINRSLSAIQGKRHYQRFFKALYYISLDGMHYGKVHAHETDGELFLIKSLKQEIERNNNQLILFDVGANEGAYTKMLLNVFEGHNINIHLFEPSSDTFKRLNQNLEDFELILNYCHPTKIKIR